MPRTEMLGRTQHWLRRTLTVWERGLVYVKYRRPIGLVLVLLTCCAPRLPRVLMIKTVIRLDFVAWHVLRLQCERSAAQRDF